MFPSLLGIKAEMNSATEGRNFFVTFISFSGSSVVYSGNRFLEDSGILESTLFSP